MPRLLPSVPVKPADPVMCPMCGDHLITGLADADAHFASAHPVEYAYAAAVCYGAQ
jgi:hypothetical protein